jgi:uncharacterized membrane protein YeaQ/YmgE (transglycosylase-associated protein family)
MSRKLAIFLFWLLGFSIGFIGYLSLPGLTGWFSTALPNFLNQSVIGALIAGMVGSALSTITVLSWANRTS